MGNHICYSVQCQGRLVRGMWALILAPKTTRSQTCMSPLAVTLGGVLLAITLFISEFRGAFRIKTKQEVCVGVLVLGAGISTRCTIISQLQVDISGRTDMMMLRLNMTMLSLPCQGTYCMRICVHDAWHPTPFCAQLLSIYSESSQLL